MEKLKSELNKRKEYELRVSEEYQKLLRNYQYLEQENRTLKGEDYNSENELNLIKKNSIKEKEVKNINKNKIDEINLEKYKQIISDINKENDMLKNEIKTMNSAVEELKNEKLKIFEQKSEIINNLRNDIENLNKQVNEGNRKSILDESIIKNHESEMQSLMDRINIFENEKAEKE